MVAADTGSMASNGSSSTSSRGVCSSAVAKVIFTHPGRMATRVPLGRGQLQHCQQPWARAATVARSRPRNNPR